MLGVHVHAPVLPHLQVASHSYPFLEMAGARSHPEKTRGVRTLLIVGGIQP
jgi:hypothetical protein